MAVTGHSWAWISRANMGMALEITCVVANLVGLDDFATSVSNR